MINDPGLDSGTNSEAKMLWDGTPILCILYLVIFFSPPLNMLSLKHGINIKNPDVNRKGQKVVFAQRLKELIM